MKMNNNVIEVVEQDSYGIKVLNFGPFLAELKNRDLQQIKVSSLIKFMSSLAGRNKSGSNNDISRLQTFLNAYTQEYEVFYANPGKISFITNDHYFLSRGGTGTNDPDFNFKSDNGNTYTIDAKMFMTRDSYYKNIDSGVLNLHKADYGLIFIIETAEWLFSRKVDNYKGLFSAEDLSTTDPWLSEINLPNSLTLIKFISDSSSIFTMSNNELPYSVDYIFYEKNYKKKISLNI